MKGLVFVYEFIILNSNELKKLIVFCLFLLSFSESNAQRLSPRDGHPSQTWHLGSLILNDGLSIEGLIKYDLESEAVHLDFEGTTRTFVANQITAFSFFQASLGVKRKFITVRFEAKGGYKRPKLFEVIYENETSLLAREESIYSNWTTLDPSGVEGVRWSRFSAFNYDYYLVNQAGDVKTVERGAKGVARSFDDHYKKLRSYMKSNKLNIKELEGMVSLVSYYNTLD